MPEGALNGVRVLDLGCGITAPHCAKVLGDYGAEVIKVEPPEGDPARRYGPFPGDSPHPEKSGLFLHLNTNKRGITLNLDSASGVAILKSLVAGVDVLVENFSPGYLAARGLSYPDLRSINPRLVLTSITPFGQSGPYRDWAATEMVVFAMSSRLYAHGLPDREPLRYAPDVISFQVGVTAAAAALAAIWRALSLGVGDWIDVSMQEAMAANVDARTVMASYTGRSAGRDRGTYGYPNGVYPCADGYMLFAAGGDRFFRRLCHAIQRLDLLEDPRWATVAARQPYKEDFDAEFLPWLLQRDRDEVFRVCQAEGVMCAPVLTIDEVYKDRQLEARGFFRRVEHPVAGEGLFPGAPFKLSETPWEVRTPAPLLGQHNTEVYTCTLGYSREDLVRLRASNVI